MSLYENWMKKAFKSNGQSVNEVWNVYLPLEQKIYEYILGEKVNDMEFKISELAEKFNMTDEQAVAFVDGINDVLPEPYDVNELTSDSDVKLHIEFDKLYKKMVEYKAEHLYSLPQWDGIFSEEERKALYKEQRNSRTVVHEGPKIGRNDPCPCGSGKKYKKCCGANL
ncbi:MAG: SEC-C metal-binding domain-containing protein [Clostridia bacterium]|nr:SEC-C metal-binding domain-containing protein [Clostridia bacterium]